MMPALLAVTPTRATPCLSVLTTLFRPTPVKRTATPFTGVFDFVTLATTSWLLPFALTMPGVTLSTRQTFTTGFGFSCGLVGFGLGVGAGGVTGAVTSVDAHARLLEPFVSLPSPVAIAQLTYVPVCVTRAETPITRSTPGPSVPRLHCSRTPPVIEQPPLTGGWVTARNVTPLGAASATVTLCAWFGPLFFTRTVYETVACPLTSWTCGVASFATCTSMNSSVGGASGGFEGGGGGVVPQPTWTLALSESVPSSHVTVAVFVRPLFGDAVPFLHVHFSSYVVVQAL